METDVKFVALKREKNMWMFCFCVALRSCVFFPNFFASHSTIYSVISGHVVMEPRDRSTPMDIDPPAYNTDRLDAFVYKHNDGPARKRTP